MHAPIDRRCRREREPPYNRAPSTRSPRGRRLRALLSVSDREGIVELARGLTDAGAEFFATDGTRAHLTEAGIEGIRPVARPDRLERDPRRPRQDAPPEDLRRRSSPAATGPTTSRSWPSRASSRSTSWSSTSIPFAQTMREPDTTLDQALEQIDIGGVALLRAAAKNFPGVAAVSEPDPVRIGPARHQDARQRQPGDPPEAGRPRRSPLTAAYDAQIACYLTRPPAPSSRAGSRWSSRRRPTCATARTRTSSAPSTPIRRMPAAASAPRTRSPARTSPSTTCSTSTRRGRIASDFKTPAVAIVKHGNPCGLACVVDLAEAFRLALEGDSVSAYGGIIGANRIDRRADGARHPARLLRGHRGARLHAGGARDPAHEARLRDRRGAAGRDTRPTTWGSASSTSSASAAACWSRPSTRWRRTATSSSPSRSGARRSTS